MQNIIRDASSAAPYDPMGFRLNKIFCLIVNRFRLMDMNNSSVFLKDCLRG